MSHPQKPLNHPAQLAANLLRLKEELWRKWGGASANEPGAEIALKLNSCLYGVYPVGFEREPSGIELKKLGQRVVGYNLTRLWSSERPSRSRRTLWADVDAKLYLSVRPPHNHGEPEPAPAWYRIVIGSEDAA